MNDEQNASGLAQFFILQPTFGLLLTVLIIAAGFIAYTSLVKESLPDLEIPQATVSTFWPGAVLDALTSSIGKTPTGIPTLARA